MQVGMSRQSTGWQAGRQKQTNKQKENQVWEVGSDYQGFDKVSMETQGQFSVQSSLCIKSIPSSAKELGVLIPGCQWWVELFQILFPWLLSNLFCCLWNRGSFPSMNSFSLCNQLWLVLFNINLFYFFSKKDTNQFCTPLLVKSSTSPADLPFS